MFSPCPLKVSSIKRRPLRLALFRTGSSVPRLDQALQGAGRPGIRRSVDIGARTRCRSLCTRASAGTVRAVSGSCPTKCPTRSGEVLLPPLARRGPRPGHSRSAALTAAGEVRSIGHRQSSRFLRIKQTRCHRVRHSGRGPHQQGRPPVRDQIRIIEPHRDPPRGVGRLHLGSALVILRAGRPKNSHRRRPQGTLIPGDITAAHWPMDPGSGVAPGNVCTPH
jgi:hypothetical protein